MNGILSKVAQEALSFIKNADKEVAKKVDALKAERERVANALMEIDDAIASALTGGRKKSGLLRRVESGRKTVRQMSAATRARISAAAKARWAKAKAAGKHRL
jgi:hypothetical protein